MPNRVGRLHELVKGFDLHLCRICALAVHEASDHAVIRIVPHSAAGARAILHEQNLTFIESEVVVIALDEGHTLTDLTEHLLRAELFIRFAYPLFGTTQGLQAMVLAVDDPTLAGQVLRRKGYRLLAEGDLPKLGE
jgi:hypothetical protein